MEIIQNQLGQDRVLRQIDFSRIRVMGESSLDRVSRNNKGEVTLYELENGPRYYIGSTFYYNRTEWKVNKIELVEVDYEGFSECILHVSPEY